MAHAPEPALEELLWTAATARILLGAEWNIQAPPNLSYADFPRLLDAGINDWGGISPVTVDHVNPRRRGRKSIGSVLRPKSVACAWRRGSPCIPSTWRSRSGGSIPLAPHVLRRSDAEGLAREDGWAAGGAGSIPPRIDGVPGLLPNSIVVAKSARLGVASEPKETPPVAAALAKSREEIALDEDDITALLTARGPDAHAVAAAADSLRREVNGDTVTYVVTRNVNYTNVCYFRCGFAPSPRVGSRPTCADGLTSSRRRKSPRRAREAWERGAVEICLQGGIHPQLHGRFLRRKSARR